METMISIDKAFRHYREGVCPLPPESLSLEGALNRVLAEEARSRIDLPPFSQSAMDGYVLRARDTRGASADSPARLKLVGEVPAGKLGEVPQIAAGEAMRIFTGGIVPAGADTVLRQEDAEVDGVSLYVKEPLEPNHDLRARGEELAEGSVLASAGTRLGAGHLGALAISGLDRVRARPAPRIALLVTGDEIVEPGRELGPGQVYNGNAPLVTGWLRSRGYGDIAVSRLPDSLGGTEQALGEAMERSDLAITTGGVSVGDRDYVMRAAERVGVVAIFWKVAQRPGKPLFFGTFGKKVLLGLPGNPGSVYACLPTHVRRVLDLLEGADPPGPDFAWGQLNQPVNLNPKREWWARCRASVSQRGEVRLEPLPRQSSHMITNLGECDALARIPRGQGDLEPGAVVLWTACGLPVIRSRRLNVGADGTGMDMKGKALSDPEN